MKKIQTSLPALRLAAVAAALFAGFAGAAHADAVSIYGVVDVFGEVGKGDKTEVSLSSGGLSGSRLGFAADKDIGGGMKVLAKLETGISADTGATGQGGRMWGRQAYAGFSGGFGSLTFGRQYTPQFLALDANDPFETGAGSTVSSGIVSIFGARADNSIVWASPSSNGVTATAMVALGESSTGSQTNGTLAALDLHYGTGPLGANLTVTSKKKLVDGGVNASAVTLSGTYDLGKAKLMGGYQAVHNSTQAADTADNRQEFFAGVQVPMGTDTLWVGGGAAKTTDVSGSSAKQFSLGWVHPLVKGADVYAVASTVSNGDATAYSTDTATAGGPAVSNGVSAKSLQVGFRYKF